MKILFLSTNDLLGGAARVTFRLAEALRALGVDARMLVASRASNEPWVAQVSPMRFRIAKTAERALIFANNGLSRRNLWKVSTAATGCGALSHPWVAEADAIVIGWINQGLLSRADLLSLARMGKPLAWWMHDLWCATGLCHIPPHECGRFLDGCGHCPLLGFERGRFDLSRRCFPRKAGIMQRLHQAGCRFLAVSQWQLDRAAESPVFNGIPLELLPHPFPVEDYDGLPPKQSGKKIIMMGAARLDDPVKDLPLAIAGLNLLGSSHPRLVAETEALFFGELKDKNALRGLHFPHRHLGKVGEQELRQLYSQSDIVLSTSQFETAGATLMEGMAAGATPVTFLNSGQSQIVQPGEGYAIAARTPEAVAAALQQALDTPLPRAAQQASIADRFSPQTIAARLLSLLS